MGNVRQCSCWAFYFYYFVLVQVPFNDGIGIFWRGKRTRVKVAAILSSAAARSSQLIVCLVCGRRAKLLGVPGQNSPD